jgi:hypothetical protein
MFRSESTTYLHLLKPPALLPVSLPENLWRLALWAPTIPTTFVGAILLHTLSTLRLPAGPRLASGRSIRPSRPARADAAKVLQRVFSVRRHRPPFRHGMPLPRSLRIVVHCYSREDMALSKYETELSFWKGNRRSAVMRNRAKRTGEVRDGLGNLRFGAILLYLVANASDVVGSGRGGLISRACYLSLPA